MEIHLHVVTLEMFQFSDKTIFSYSQLITI